MRILRNIAYIKSKRRQARWTALIGFALLSTTFWLAINPELIAIAYLLLFFGFITFNMGMQQIGKWSRHPRNDVVLDDRLRSLSDKYTLIHYPPMGKRSAEHVLVYPGGLLVFTVRELHGKILGRGNRWRRKGSGLRRLFSFSGPQLGNPSLDTERSVGAVEQFLSEHQYEADVLGAIVFINPLAELDVEAPDYPVLLDDELTGFISDLPDDPSLSSADREALIALLGGGQNIEHPAARRTRRPVKRRAA